MFGSLRNVLGINIKEHWFSVNCFICELLMSYLWDYESEKKQLKPNL